MSRQMKMCNYCGVQPYWAKDTILVKRLAAASGRLKRSETKIFYITTLLKRILIKVCSLINQCHTNNMTSLGAGFSPRLSKPIDMI